MNINEYIVRDTGTLMLEMWRLRAENDLLRATLAEEQEKSAALQAEVDALKKG